MEQVEDVAVGRSPPRDQGDRADGSPPIVTGCGPFRLLPTGWSRSSIVDHVVTGGTAANLHGSDMVTCVVDITPDADPAHLDRLSAALRDLEARTRVEGIPDGLPFDHAGASLAGARVWNLATVHGDLDISFVPDGTAGYDDLVSSAVVLDLGATRAVVASLDDIIRSKEVAGGDKDLYVLPRLRFLRDPQG